MIVCLFLASTDGVNRMVTRVQINVSTSTEATTTTKKIKSNDPLLDAFKKELTLNYFTTAFKTKEPTNKEHNFAFKLFKLWF